MDELRKKIDECDEKIIYWLVERFEVVKQIGEYKKQHNMPIVDKNREQKVYDKVQALAAGKLSPKLVTQIWQTIIAGAVSLEENK